MNAILLQEEGGLSLLVLACLMGVMLLVALVFLSAAIRIVPEYQRLAIFRLGRFVGVRGPGLMVVFPIVDVGVKVDLREQERSRTETAVTRDGARVSVDLAWRYKVIDPAKSVLEIGNLDSGLQSLIAEALHSAMADTDFMHVGAERKQIGETICAGARAAAEKWGASVEVVTIRDITRA